MGRDHLRRGLWLAASSSSRGVSGEPGISPDWPQGEAAWEGEPVALPVEPGGLGGQRLPRKPAADWKSAGKQDLADPCVS